MPRPGRPTGWSSPQARQAAAGQLQCDVRRRACEQAANRSCDRLGRMDGPRTGEGTDCEKGCRGRRRAARNVDTGDTRREARRHLPLRRQRVEPRRSLHGRGCWRTKASRARDRVVRETRRARLECEQFLRRSACPRALLPPSNGRALSCRPPCTPGVSTAVRRLVKDAAGGLKPWHASDSGRSAPMPG